MNTTAFKFSISNKSRLNHKQIGCSKINIQNYSELKKYYEEFRKKFNTNIIIQEQVIGEFNEVIIGIKYDKIFGDICLIGIGGIYTELLKDFIILSLPFDINILERRLRDLKLYLMLNGFRNRPKVNINLLYENIMKLYELYKKEKLLEIEINPLLINEKELYAVDPPICKAINFRYNLLFVKCIKILKNSI
jgi:hypothetical protein